MTIRRSEDRENNILLEKFEWQMSDRFNCCVQITDFFASFWQEMRKNQEKNWFEEMYVCILFWLLSQLAFFHWFMCQILVRDNFSAYHTQKKQEIYFKICQIFGIQNHKSIRATHPSLEWRSQKNNWTRVIKGWFGLMSYLGMLIHHF